MSRFDDWPDRTGTFSTKWQKYQGDVLPMWVADMDFVAPPEVISALHRRTDHGVFGYTQPPDELTSVFLNYLASRFDWQVEAEHLAYLIGVVPGLNMACRLLAPGESAITVTPVYHPFLSAPENFDRQLIRVPVEETGERYRYPVERLREAIEPHTRLLLLCNPYNPVGRMLEAEELRQVASLCVEHGIILCSDEIHCELIFDGRTHIPAAKALPAVADHLITLMSPGKTYNLAGIGGAVAVISNPDLMSRYVNAGEGITGNVSLYGYEAMLTAYRDCEYWREELITYLQSNRDYLKQRIEGIPGIKMNHVEATYLAWLNVKALGLKDPAGHFEQAGVGMSPGPQFDGEGYLRLNFGCPREMLALACDRIEAAV